MTFPPDKVTEVTRRIGTRLPGRGNGDRTAVHVAIFDTWPMQDGGDTLGLVGACRDRLRSHGVMNLRMEDAAEGLLVPHARIYDHVSASPLRGMPCPHRDCDGRLYDPYRLSDHGLFVADLIGQIAPEAVLSVYRVLTDWGPGDMDTVAGAVEDAIGRAAGAPLVLNFSFGFGPELLLTSRLLREAQSIYLDGGGWSRQSSARAPSEAARSADLETATLRAEALLASASNEFAGALAAVDHIFAMADLPSVLAVAAAGNDSCRPRRLFGPRLPAAVEGIVGVSAVSRDGKVAHYSNADDIFGPDDGVGAYGGEAEHGRTTDGLVGLYISEDLPPGGPGGNTHGRAAWAGTSFATPIVSAVAARLWAEARDGTASAAIRDALVSDTSAPHGERPFIALFQE